MLTFIYFKFWPSLTFVLFTFGDKNYETMTTLDLRTELKHLIDAEQNPSVLEALRTLLTRPQEDWWDSISEEERAEIEQGIAEADRGEFISHEEVMKNPKKWL